MKGAVALAMVGLFVLQPAMETLSAQSVAGESSLQDSLEVAQDSLVVKTFYIALADSLKHPAKGKSNGPEQTKRKSKVKT